MYEENSREFKRIQETCTPLQSRRSTGDLQVCGFFVVRESSGEVKRGVVRGA